MRKIEGEIGKPVASRIVTMVDGRQFDKPPADFRPGVFLYVSAQAGRGSKRSNLPKRITVARVNSRGELDTTEYPRKPKEIAREENRMWELYWDMEAQRFAKLEAEAPESYDEIVKNQSNETRAHGDEAEARGGREVEAFLGKPLQPRHTYRDFIKTKIYRLVEGSNVAPIDTDWELETLPSGGELYKGVDTWFYRDDDWHRVTPAKPEELLRAKLKKAGINP